MYNVHTLLASLTFVAIVQMMILNVQGEYGNVGAVVFNNTIVQDSNGNWFFSANHLYSNHTDSILDQFYYPFPNNFNGIYYEGAHFNSSNNYYRLYPQPFNAGKHVGGQRQWVINLNYDCKVITTTGFAAVLLAPGITFVEDMIGHVTLNMTGIWLFMPVGDDYNPVTVRHLKIVQSVPFHDFLKSAQNSRFSN
eukprot:TRINITY_DN18204_c0_g1_i1.p1 TRINITY_DN18204_c0_g1~~TRINITY_DN18204_c0_g1_i1.p1  ORF type:complete len:206 (+),score=11.52 TRINITY_DN18204_c0_g1_i1:39-620(+)